MSKLLTVIIVVILVSVTLAAYSVKRCVDLVIKQKLTSALNEAFKGQYSFTAKNVETNFFNGTAALTDVELHSNNDDIQKPVINLKIKAIELSGISWQDYIRNKDLGFDDININYPEIFYREPVEKSINTSKSIEELIPEFLSGFKKAIRIRQFSISDGKISYITGKPHQLKSTSCDNINILLSNIKLSGSNNQPFIISENASFSISNICITQEKKKELYINKIEGHSNDSSLQISGLSLNKYCVNQCELSGFIENIEASGFQIPKTLKKFNITTNTLEIDKGNITISPAKQAQPLPVAESGLENIKVNNLTVKNINLNGNNNSGYHYSANLALEAKKLFKRKNTNAINSDDIEFELTDLHLKNGNTENLLISAIAGSTKRNTVNIQNISFHQKSKNLTPKIDLKIPKINLVGIKFHKLLQQELKIKQANVYAPSAAIDLYEDKNRSSDFKGLNDLVVSICQKTFKVVDIHHLNVDRGDLHLNYEKNIDNIIEQKFEGILLKSSNLQYHKDRLSNGINPNELSIKIDQYTLNCNSGNFTLSASNVDANGNQRVFQGKNLQIKQLKSHGVNQEFYFMNTSKAFRFEDIDFNKLLNQNILNAKALVIDSIDLKIDQDERKIVIESQENFLMKNILNLVPFQFSLGSFIVHDGTLEYSDIPMGNREKANLNVSEISISTDGISNAPNYQKTTKFECSSKIFGVSYYNFELKMPLMSNQFECEYSGNLGSIEGKHFNGFMVMADLSIEKGQFEDISCSFKIKNEKATGTMTMLYDDLKLSVLSKSGKKKKTLSFLSRFFIKRNNSENNTKPIKVATINTTFQTNAGFFNYLWLPMKEGMIKTVCKKEVFANSY